MTRTLNDDWVYNRWIGIKARCYNKKFHRYAFYGKRGITMWRNWLNDFPSFKEYVTSLPGFSRNLELDRIDTHGNYEPGNIRWATRKEQTQNRKTNNNKKYKGVRRRQNRYDARITLDGRTLYLGVFPTDRQAAEAYNRAALKYFKEHAYLNIVE